MTKTINVKDRSITVKFSDSASIDIETRNNKHIQGIAVYISDKKKQIRVLDIDFENGKFIRNNDELTQIKKRT